MALLTGAEKGNPAAQSLLRRVRSRGKRIYNRLACRFAPPFEPLPRPPRRPFILYLLHVQPEASVDVFGSYHSDQIDNAVALARSLPANCDLYVKEHPSGLGCRSRAEYRRMKAIPGALLIDPATDSFALLREARLVVSVTGTSSYEAGLLGTPAVTLAPMFFQPVLAAPPLEPKSLMPRKLEELISRYAARSDEEKRAVAEAFLAALLASSFPAAASDPISNPACMDPENLRTICSAIEQLGEARTGAQFRATQEECAT